MKIATLKTGLGSLALLPGLALAAAPAVADKADNAADRNGGSHQQGAAQQQDPLHGGHLHAEIVRLFVAQLQQVEGPCQTPDNQHGGDHQRRDVQQRRPLRLAKAAHSPE